MTHWHRLSHRGRQWDTCFGRPLEVCIPFTGGDVVGPDLKPTRSRRNKTHDFFYDAGWNVTYQHPKAPFIWHFNSELNRENKFKLHVVPDLIFVHLPHRTSLASEVSPVNKLSPIDKKMIMQVSDLIVWCSKLNPQLKFVMFIPICCDKYWLPMDLHFLGNFRGHAHKRVDFCFFDHPHRDTHYVYSNDHKLLNDCEQIYQHDRRNMSAKNQCGEHSVYETDYHHPNRKVPVNFIKKMVQHFTMTMMMHNYHYLESLLTHYFPVEPKETYHEFNFYASPCEKRTQREWLSLKYEEFMDDFYDHSAHDHYNNGDNDNHIRFHPDNRPKVPEDSTSEKNSEQESDKEENKPSAANTSLVLPDQESSDNEDSGQHSPSKADTSMVLPDVEVDDHGDKDEPRANLFSDTA